MSGDAPDFITKAEWETFLQSPVAAHPIRMVGEDEFRFVGSVSAVNLNLIFGQSNTPVDIEILEITLQPASQVDATITIGGTPITGTWTLQALQFWSSPGFILERGKQIVLLLSAAVVVKFEVRWRLYFGRKIK